MADDSSFPNQEKTSPLSKVTRQNSNPSQQDERDLISSSMDTSQAERSAVSDELTVATSEIIRDVHNLEITTPDKLPPLRIEQDWPSTFKPAELPDHEKPSMQDNLDVVDGVVVEYPGGVETYDLESILTESVIDRYLLEDDNYLPIDLINASQITISPDIASKPYWPCSAERRIICESVQTCLEKFKITCAPSRAVTCIKSNEILCADYSLVTCNQTQYVSSVTPTPAPGEKPKMRSSTNCRGESFVLCLWQKRITCYSSRVNCEQQSNVTCQKDTHRISCNGPDWVTCYRDSLVNCSGKNRISCYGGRQRITK